MAEKSKDVVLAESGTVATGVPPPASGAADVTTSDSGSVGVSASASAGTDVAVGAGTGVAVGMGTGVAVAAGTGVTVGVGTSMGAGGKLTVMVRMALSEACSPSVTVSKMTWLPTLNETVINCPVPIWPSMLEFQTSESPVRVPSSLSAPDPLKAMLSVVKKTV